MEINYALVAVVMGDSELDILHFCGFKNIPSVKDRIKLQERLQSDSKYNMTDKMISDYQLQEASPSLIQYYKNLDQKDEDSYYVDEEGAVVKM
jgi:hypothetical protein